MAPLLASLCLSYSVSNAQVPVLDPSQVYTTPDLVLPTNQGGPTPWVNGVYQDSLTCWAWGNPGYCGPNAIVRPGNNINFSYGTTDLYQSQAVTNLLPNTGSGLRVNGYNFGFMAKNGNGWDDGRVDYLNAYTHFTNQNNEVVFYKNYDLTSKFDWTYFNFSETFNTPFASKDLKNVTYGFVGRDNNFWAGPYGPEIYNVNFSLKYSVDPCYVNVLSSPSCPGYTETLAKLNTTTTTTIPEPVVTTTTTTVATPTVTYSPAPETTTNTTPLSTPTAVVSTVANTPTVSTTPTPTASNPQPKVGEVSQGSAPKTVSMSQILSIIATENSRIGAVERSTVESTTQQANAVASSTAQQAESVASNATSQSIQSSIQLNQNEIQSRQTVTQFGQSSVSLQRNDGQGIQLNQFTNQSNQKEFGQLNPILNFQQSQTTSNFDIATNNKQEERNERVFSIINNLNTQTNSLQTTETKQENQKSSVNQKAQDNSAAGGVTLASIAQQPAGFQAYLVGMPDSAFYKPKEIYRNQRNVDNPAGRRLVGGSDRVFDEMVKQQYK